MGDVVEAVSGSEPTAEPTHADVATELLPIADVTKSNETAVADDPETVKTDKKEESTVDTKETDTEEAGAENTESGAGGKEVEVTKEGEEKESEESKEPDECEEAEEGQEAEESKGAKEKKNEAEDSKETREENKVDGKYINNEKPKKFLKTKRKIDKVNWSKNSKFDPSSLETSNEPTEIRHQVEFYFGDANYPYDKFLWESCGGEENKPIKIKQISTFKRMVRFQPYEDVVAALRASHFLTVSGEPGEELVARKKPYQANQSRNKSEPRSVYVKGFGDEEATTQLKIEKWAGQFGECEAVRLRRTDEGLFKGSAFIQFATDETAQNFLALEPKPTWNGHELNIKSKRDYCKEKVEQIRNGEIQPSFNNKKRYFEGKAGTDRARPHGRGGGSRENRDNNRNGRHEGKNGNFRGGRRGGRGGRGGHGGHGVHHGSSLPRGGVEKRNSIDDSDRPVIKTSTPPQKTADAVEASSVRDDTASTKRARDDDGSVAQPPAKKVDTKPEVAATEGS